MNVSGDRSQPDQPSQVRPLVDPERYRFSEVEGCGHCILRGVAENERSVLIFQPTGGDPSIEAGHIGNYQRIGRHLDPRAAAIPIGSGLHRGADALFIQDPGGNALRALLVSGPLEIGRFLAIARSLAECCRLIHDADITHWNLKPEYVLVDEHSGSCRLIGFHGATRVERPDPRAVPGPFFDASSQYLAPEQAGGTPTRADGRTDIFALGVIYHEMLTGELPDALRGPICRGERALNGHDLARISQEVSLSDRLHTIIGRMLAVSIDERYPSVLALINDLERCLAAWNRTGGPGSTVSAPACRFADALRGAVSPPDGSRPSWSADPRARGASTGTLAIGELRLETVMKLSQMISGEVTLDSLTRTLMAIALEYGSADRALLLMPSDAQLQISAEAWMEDGFPRVRQATRPAAVGDYPQDLIRQALRERRSRVLNEAEFAATTDVRAALMAAGVQSALCVPLLRQAMLVGLLYLERHHPSGPFLDNEIALLTLVASHAASAIETTRLYSDLHSEIAERRKIEGELRQSEAFLAEGQRISRTGNWRWDVARAVIDGSEGLYRIFGRDRSDGMTVEEYLGWLHPEDRSRVQALKIRVLSEKLDFQYEYRLQLPNGEYGHFLTKGVREPRADGEFYVGTTVELTELRLAEEATKAAEARLERASRLTMIGELAGSIVHEINQPLSAMMNNIEVCRRWLDRPVPEYEAAKSSLEKLKAHVQRVANVVSGLRSLSKRTGPGSSTILLASLIEDTMPLVRSELARADATVEIRFDGLNPCVRADSVQIQQIFVNLLRNAIEAMSENLDRGKAISVELRCDGGQAVLAVSDSGTGIPGDLLEAVFEPLFTTKPEGMGMGLAICRSVAEAHGGTLVATSLQPYGTCMTLTLPIEAEGS